MSKKNSKKSIVIGAIGAVAATSVGAGIEANAVQTGIFDWIPEGFTDENGQLCGYYKEDGTWVGNKLQWRFRYNKNITLKVYKVSDTVDTNKRETYKLNKNTVDSKWCVQDANNRRIIPNAKMRVKDMQGNVVATYVTDKNGFIYYDNLPMGEYILEAVSLPSGYEFQATTITRFQHVEDVTFTYYGEWLRDMGLTYPTGTYVIWWKEFDDYRGFQEIYHDQFYGNGHPHQLVLKMNGMFDLQWGSMGEYYSEVEVGYVAYEVDLDGNDLGVVKGVGASVEKVYNIDGSYEADRVSTNDHGLASLIYSGKEPENYEYMFTIDKLPDNLMLRYPKDAHFSWVPGDGIHGDTLIYYVPVIATSDVKLKVYDQKTGKCISGAKVQLLDSKGNVVANKDGVSQFITTGADEDGYNCLLEDLMVGNYQVKIIELPDDGTEDGYAYPATVTNITSTKDVVNGYDIPIAHNGFVKVNVLDVETGNAILDPNIKVNLYQGTSETPFATLTLDEFETYYRKGKIVEDTNVKVELSFPTGAYILSGITHNTANGPVSLNWSTASPKGNVVSTILSRDGFDLTYSLTVRTGSLSVKVQDKITKAPIANATVSIYDKDGNVVATPKTGANGEIYIEKLVPGQYTAKVTDSEGKYLPSNDVLNLNVVIEETTSGILELERDCGYVTVSVKELLTNGNLANFNQKVNLVIKDASGKTVHTYQTDANGKAAALLLDSADYTVLIQDALTGYTLHELNGKDFTVSYGNTTDVVLTVERDRNDLSVYVVDDDTNKPLANSEVTVYDANGNVYGTATTDDNGCITMDSVPTGTYSALVTKPATGYNAPATKQTFHVTKEQDGTTTIRLARKKADVTIYVKDFEENIVPGAIVEFGYYDANDEFVPLVGNDGTGDKTEFSVGTTGYVTLKNVPTDKYVARVKAPYPKHYTYTVYSEEEFTVVENKNNEVTLRLSKMRMGLFINVIDAETKEVIPNVVVTIIPSEKPENKQNKTTDEYGVADFGVLDCDVYAYFAAQIPEGYSAPALEYIDLDAEFNSMARLISFASRTIELTRDKQSLTVTVRDKLTNEVIPNATVTVTDSDGGTHTAVSDENGVVYFDKIPTGKVTIETTDVPENYTADEAVTTTITKDTPATATIYVNRDRGNLLVTSYVAGTDTVLPNCTIDIINVDTNEVYATVKTDANGQATINNIPTGNYKVVITEAPKNYDPVTEATIEIANGENHNARVEAKREDGKLQVIVKDGKGTPESDDDILLKNVDVLITEIETGKTYNVQTDENGQFTTDFLPTGQYKIEITGGLSYVYTVPAAKTAEIFYKEEPTIVIFNLTEDKNALHIKVVEADSKAPLANISVTLSDGNTYTTDEYGYVHIPEILVGEYVAAIDGNKLSDLYKLNENSSKSVIVTKDVEGNVVLEVARKKGDLDISVKDKDTNEPIPDAKVEIYDKDGNKVGEGTTDENGNLVVENLPTGDYTIKVTEVPDGYNKPDDTTITIEDDKTTETVIEVEKQKGDLDITVKDKDTNEPIPDAKVEIYDKDGNKVGEGTTDENGKLVIEDLPIGDYTIKVTEVPEGYNKPDDTKVTIEDEKTTETIITVEKQKGDLDITVKDKDTNEPIPDAKVEIYDKDGNKVGEGTTDENGKLVVEDLPIGDYDIKVEEVPDGYNKPDDTTVTIEKDKTTETIITVEKQMGDLDITVKDKDTHEIIPNANVEIYDKDGNKVGEGTTDANGKLVVEDLPIGDYTIKVTEVPDGYNKPDDTTVTIEDKKTTEIIIEVEKKKGDLDITVKDKDTNEPIPGAKVEIYDKDGNKVGEGTTDENGKLVVEDLPIGDYDIKVEEVPDGYNKPDDTTVTVEEDKTTETVITVEKQKGNLDITVKDKDTSALIPGAKVEIYDKDGNKVGEGTTDENGKLVVENLPIGDYTIKVTEVPDGYNKPDDTTVTVEEDKTTETVITIEKQKGNLKVTVVDKETQNPLGNALVAIIDANGTIIGTYRTEGNGLVYIENLLAGKYTVSVIQAPDGYSAPDAIEVVVEDKKVAEQVVELTRDKGNLSIVVEDKETKELIPNITVVVKDENGKVVGEFVTNENGQVIVKDLPTGTYSIETKDLPATYKNNFGYIATVEKNETTNVLISLEKAKGNLTMVAKEKDTSNYIKGVEFELYDSEGNLIGTFTSDEDGKALAEALLVGRYSVKVTKVPEGFKLPANAKELEIVDDMTTTVVFDLERVEENVQTGDNSNIGLYGLLAGVSGLGILSTRKKKDKNTH